MHRLRQRLWPDHRHRKQQFAGVTVGHAPAAVRRKIHILTNKKKHTKPTGSPHGLPVFYVLIGLTSLDVLEWSRFQAFCCFRSLFSPPPPQFLRANPRPRNLPDRPRRLRTIPVQRVAPSSSRAAFCSRANTTPRSPRFMTSRPNIPSPRVSRTNWASRI